MSSQGAAASTLCNNVACVWQHAFGHAGGAAGVGQQGQIIATHRDSRRLQLAVQHGLPGVQLQVRDLRQRMAHRQPVLPHSWPLQDLLHMVFGQSLGQIKHHQMLQRLTSFRHLAGAGQLGGDVRRGNGHMCLGVQDVMPQLIGLVHRVDRYHHRAQTNHRMKGDDELRAVLHEQNDPLALLHAQCLQATSQVFGALQQLLPGVCAPQIVQSDVMRCLRSTRLQPRTQGFIRHIDPARNALRPKTQVGLWVVCGFQGVIHGDQTPRLAQQPRVTGIDAGLRRSPRRASSSLASDWRCTSSGPSAKRKVRWSV